MSGNLEKQEILKPFLKYDYAWKSHNCGSPKFWNFEKDRCRKIPTIRLIYYWKSWIWDQYLPENMDWNLSNMGSLKLWSFETSRPGSQETFKKFEAEKLWNQEALTPRNFETDEPINQQQINNKIREKSAGPSLEGDRGCGFIVQCRFNH